MRHTVAVEKDHFHKKSITTEDMEVPDEKPAALENDRPVRPTVRTFV